MDEGHAQAAAVRAQVEEVGDGADLLDLDLGARLGGLFRRRLVFLLLRRLGERLGLEAAEIGMAAGEVPAAALAAPAGLRAGGRLAQQELRDALGERELADALHAVDQQRVRQPFGARRDGVEDRLVPGMHQKTRCFSIALRMVTRSPVASITRTRAGSALARSR